MNYYLCIRSTTSTTVSQGPSTRGPKAPPPAGTQLQQQQQQQVNGKCFRGMQLLMKQMREVEETRRMVTAENEYVCINCCHPSSSLFVKYSDNGIRLTSCFNCGKAVDAYIEYDTVLVVIDLMLQYIEAYRHFLMNTSNRVQSSSVNMQQCKLHPSPIISIENPSEWQNCDGGITYKLD
ncbi:unnamed protein product [Acanthocheilonema viteae]|uniref:Protein ARV n=1 Tax=Acanthocheilonema viteae TaxID=6277 RepID=A0A498SBX6_ACAVI|nr:unnamed protein product [Acanthocheilonema viteae]